MKKRTEKFYDNQEHIHSPRGRILRIMSEYVGPEEVFRKNKIQDTIVFFGSARTQPKHLVSQAIEKAKADGSNVEKLEQLERDLGMSRYYEDARELAYK
ncbi:MAG: lysine decarboxylase, partial [Candidatus Marinimicrobia bacterium]|nr:lysine decarboxylase [Candidatus Neomarinimicrobiota bacterium]